MIKFRFCRGDWKSEWVYGNTVPRTAFDYSFEDHMALEVVNVEGRDAA